MEKTGIEKDSQLSENGIKWLQVEFSLSVALWSPAIHQNCGIERRTQSRPKATPENNDEMMPARPWGSSTCLWHGLLKDLCVSQYGTRNDTSSSWHRMGTQNHFLSEWINENHTNDQAISSCILCPFGRITMSLKISEVSSQLKVTIIFLKWS